MQKPKGRQTERWPSLLQNDFNFIQDSTTEIKLFRKDSFIYDPDLNNS